MNNVSQSTYSEGWFSKISLLSQTNSFVKYNENEL